jgi:deoxyribonuclease-4
MQKLGAHLSISSGYSQALKQIKKIGGNCLQIFSSSPRSWQGLKLTQNQIKEFLTLKQQLKINPIFYHASYLINLADAGRVGDLSKKALINELTTASVLGIKGSIIHLGSFKESPSLFTFTGKQKYHILIKNINEVLTKTPDNSWFIIENSGTKKIGQSLDEIAYIIKELNHSRLKVCLDTCHLFSAGYDLRTKNNLNKFLEEFNQKIGLNKLVVWHLNDSRDPFASGRDRHENIGQGTIGQEEFRLIINHPQLKLLPFIIETPGFVGQGPDKKNLDILKGLRQ